MAEDKKSFLFYSDFIHTFEALKDNEAGKLIKHILRYVNDLNPTCDNKIVSIAFEPIKQQLKRDLKKWDSIREKRSGAGKISAEKRKQKPTNPTHVESVEQKPTNPTVNDNGNVTVNVNVKEREVPLSPNFFYIGTELFKMPISEWLKSAHAITLEAWVMKNKEVKIEKVFEIMDKDVGKPYGDYNHPLSYFKSIAKELVAGKFKNNHTDQSNVKATGNYGPKK